MSVNSLSKRHCMVVFAHYPAGETRVQRQAEALINNGFEVDIICLRILRSGYEPPQETVNGAQVYRLSVTRSFGNISFMTQLWEYIAFFIRAMFALMRLYPQRRYNIIQLHNLPDFLVFAAWFPKLLGARLILDLHDLMPEFYASRIGRDMNNWLVRLLIWQEQLSCRFANHVITVTELWRQALIQRGVPSDKVSVVMNVADDRIFRRSANGTSPKEDGKFHLFYHGAVVPRYGIDFILEAMASLRHEISDLRLTIHGGGNGSYKASLVQLTHQLGLDDCVSFSTDFYPISELPKLIRTADVAVIPYRRDVFTDGILPTKLMEYTALGIPAIVARTSAIESYFDETMVEFFIAGNVKELANSIRKLYKDRTRLQSLIEKSDKFNQCYNWSKQSADYIALVKRLGGN